MKERPKEIMTITLIGINILVFIVLTMIGRTEDGYFMLQHGAMYEPYIIENQEYYRLFTSLFLHFGILLYIARHKKKDGQVAACYLIFYSIGRFVLEFFRGDLIRGSVGMLSTSQFISLFILVAGILILVIRSKKKTATDL